MDRRVIIPPIPDRTDFAEVADKMIKRGHTTAVEIGVFRGEFTKHNLKYWSGEYYMVDAWAHRPGGGQDKNWEDSGVWDEIKAEALQNKCYHIQATSSDAAKQFDENSVDWVYIDAGHTYDDVIKDMVSWWPKLREGGLFSGDDYGSSCLYNNRMEPSLAGIAKAYNWGVIEAVNDFAKIINRQVHVTWINDKWKTPNWYIIK